MVLTALLGVILVVQGAFATFLAMAPKREGTLGQTKLSPIAKSLHGKVSPPSPPRRQVWTKPRSPTTF